MYVSPRPDSEVVYLRFAFVGQITGHDSQRALDAGIIAARWLSRDAALADRPGCAAPWCLAVLKIICLASVTRWT